MTGRRALKQSGVTLIELMIAISLVAILLAGLLTAMRAGLITHEKTAARLNANRRVMNVQQILASQLENAMPVAGLCPSSDSEKPAALLPFFVGTETALRMITNYSIAEGARGYPQIVEYQVQPLAGGFRLAVAEHAFTGPASTAVFCADLQPRPVALGASALILADNLAACSLAYHPAYDPFTYRETPWVTLWDAKMTKLPAAVRIQMKAANAVPAGLPVVSFTIPIRADRNPLGRYADIY